jgi:peptide/nickel transport system substrate-binding protein
VQDSRYRPGRASSALSRRSLLRRAALGSAGITGLGLAACGGSSKGGNSKPAAGPAGQTTPKRGGTLTVSEAGISGVFSRGFDPHILQATDTGMFGLFYSTLISQNPKTFELEPALASKWEVPSPTELVFTISPNVKWHDKPPASGRALKVDDIIYSYNRIKTDDPKFINKLYLNNVDKMEAPDDHTLKLTLKQPDVTQLGNLGVFSMKILAPEVVEKAGKFATADTCVGTGAFVLQTSDSPVGASLVRNPTYFKAGLPYLDRVEYKSFKDFESEWAAFLSGQLDYRWVPGDQSGTFANANKDKYSFGWLGDQIYFITQAMTKKKPWDDARITRAMRLLMDHNEFESAWATSWFGRGRQSACFSSATADVWDLSEDEYSKLLEWKPAKDDAIKEALSLLSAAGFTKDKPLKFTLSGTNANDYQAAMVQLAQAQYKKNSQGAVDPEIKYFDTPSWAATRAQGTFEYYVAGHSSGGIDPDTYFSSTYQTGGGRNYGKMSDPQLDQMFAKQRTIFDEKERKKAVRDIILYMVDHCPYGSVVADYILYATPARIQAFPGQGPTFKWGDHYENIWVNR